MFDFFDKHAVKDGRHCCGSNKRLAMRYSELFASNGTRISFLDGKDDAHPINNIFRTMLALMRLLRPLSAEPVFLRPSEDVELCGAANDV